MATTYTNPRPAVHVDAKKVGEVAVVWHDSQWLDLLALLVAFGSVEQVQRTSSTARRCRSGAIRGSGGATRSRWWCGEVQPQRCYGWAFLAARREKRLAYGAL